MGKIRVAALGSEDVEKELADKAKKRREAKKQKKAKSTDSVEGAVQEEAVVEAVDKVEGSSAEPAVDASKKAVKGAKKPAAKTETDDTEKTSRKASPKAIKKGKKYTAAKKNVDPNTSYALDEAVKLVKKMSYVSFDETIELHGILKDKDVKGEVTLPHGTGKEVIVAIADDKVLAQIEAGNIEFDVLVSSPSMMPKVMKHARVLGPKGLMPNPKKGTVSDKPEEAASKFKSGSVYYKSESKFPLLHQAVGKKSFSDEQLLENIKELVKAVGKTKLTSVYIAASMTPSVRVDVNTL